MRRLEERYLMSIWRYRKSGLGARGTVEKCIGDTEHPCDIDT